MLNRVAQIYNENGDKFNGLTISNVDGDIVGLSYTDNNGTKQNITLNLNNIDITKPEELARAIAHETTDIEKHNSKEGNAVSRIMEILIQII